MRSRVQTDIYLVGTALAVSAEGAVNEVVSIGLRTLNILHLATVATA